MSNLRQAERSRSLKPNQFQLQDGVIITERPILFQTEMVQANLEGRKTQTRRANGLKELNKNPDPWFFKGNPLKLSPDTYVFGKNNSQGVECFNMNFNSPYGKPGDLLWVRETFTEWSGMFQYKVDTAFGDEIGIWKPSIHMPKAASRIWAMVEEIRVERVQDISEEDAIAEGLEKWKYDFGDLQTININKGKTLLVGPPIWCFLRLWISINGEASWDSNPWVWVVKYRILSKTGRPSLETIAEAYSQISSLQSLIPTSHV